MYLFCNDYKINKTCYSLKKLNRKENKVSYSNHSILDVIWNSWLMQFRVNVLVFFMGLIQQQKQILLLMNAINF
jgi:hypothetical protein